MYFAQLHKKKYRGSPTGRASKMKPAGERVKRGEKKHTREYQQRELFRDNDRVNDSLETWVEGRADRADRTNTATGPRRRKTEGSSPSVCVGASQRHDGRLARDRELSRQRFSGKNAHVSRGESTERRRTCIMRAVANRGSAR